MKSVVYDRLALTFARTLEPRDATGFEEDRHTLPDHRRVEYLFFFFNSHRTIDNTYPGNPKGRRVFSLSATWTINSIFIRRGNYSRYVRDYSRCGNSVNV